MPWKSRFSIVFLWFIRAKKASTARRLECDGEAPSPRVWHCACQAVHGQWPLGTLGTFFQQRKGAKPPWNQPTNSDFNGISWWFHGILWFNQHGDRKPTKLVIKCIRTYKDNMWYMFFFNLEKHQQTHDKSRQVTPSECFGFYCPWDGHGPSAPVDEVYLWGQYLAIWGPAK